MIRIDNKISTLALACAVAAAVFCGPASAAGSLKAAYVEEVIPAHTYTGHMTVLNSVSTAGPEHAWAVGVTSGTSGLAPLIETWNGSAWSPVTLSPAQIGALGPNPFLTTTSATGPHNVWAFSYEGGWLHRSGSGWK